MKQKEERTINNCIFVGRLVRDPELRYLPNGGMGVCNFTLAVDKALSKEKKQEFEAQGKHTCDFLDFVAWGGMGETIANYFKKGGQIAVQSSVETGSYDHKDGHKVYTTKFRVNSFDFLGNNGGGNEGSNNSNNASDNSGFDGDGFQPVNDSEIPF